MKKPKILKSLPKSKTSKQKVNKTPNATKKSTVIQPQNAYAEKYLQFYDDIKTPSKRHDW